MLARHAPSTKERPAKLVFAEFGQGGLVEASQFVVGVICLIIDSRRGLMVRKLIRRSRAMLYDQDSTVYNVPPDRHAQISGSAAQWLATRTLEGRLDVGCSRADSSLHPTGCLGGSRRSTASHSHARHIGSHRHCQGRRAGGGPLNCPPPSTTGLIALH